MNTEKKFILFILIISLTYFICEKQNNIVEGLTNNQCTMLGKIPVLGGFLKSFLCPIKPCNANDNNPTTQECLCNEITPQLTLSHSALFCKIFLFSSIPS